MGITTFALVRKTYVPQKIYKYVFTHKNIKM